MQVRKILIPLDPSASSKQIVPAVRDLFAPEGTELTLLAVVPLPSELATMAAGAEGAQPAGVAPGDPATWERHYKSAEAELRSAAQPLQKAGYQVTTLVRGGDPVEEILTCLAEGNYALIAMTTHGQTGLDRLLLGSVAERVLRRAQRPLLLLRPFVQSGAQTTLRTHSLQAARAGEGITLAIATDGSTHAQQARALAVQLTQAFQAQLQVIVIADEHQDASIAQHLMQDVQQRLGDWASNVQFIPLVGRTDIVLERYLSEHPVDLLVIGAFKDRDAGAQAHIGVTAQQVVQHLPLSVLVAKGYQPQLRKLLAVVVEEDHAVIEVAAEWAHALNAELGSIRPALGAGCPLSRGHKYSIFGTRGEDRIFSGRSAPNVSWDGLASLRSGLKRVHARELMQRGIVNT